MLKAIFTALLVLGTLPTTAVAQNQTASTDTIITIGTGSADGVYYPTGNAICRLLSRDYLDHRIRCGALPSEGSVANLQDLKTGKLQLAVVQSDWLYHAHHGSSRFADAGADPNLRTVLELHAESFTVVASKDSNAKRFRDLRDKHINLGNPGSGQRATAQVLLEALNWTLADFTQVLELPAGEQAAALCDNRVDAIVYTVGHPNTSILETTAVCESVILAVTGEAVEQLIEERPYYTLSTVPGGLYRNNPEPVSTFGVQAVLVARADVPADVIYQLVDTVMTNVEEFQRQHPALGNLQPSSLVGGPVTVPWHEGTARWRADHVSEGILEIIEDQADTQQ